MQRKRIAVLCFAFAALFLLNATFLHQAFSSNPNAVAVKFLEKVAGINMDDYTVVSCNESTHLMPNSPHLQTDIRLMIGNSQKEFDVLITLVDNKLWHYRLNLLSGNLTEGSQSFTDALSTLNGVASGYETFFNATYSGDFAQAVMKASENQSRQVENDKSSLKIKYAEAESTLLEYTQVQWFQKINNQFMSPFRSIAASVSETGLLTRFTDNIALHWVATTNIATSKENAISIAMPDISTYAGKHEQQVTAVNATLQYVNDLTSSRGDSFALYPQWQVSARFDKVNNETASGYIVYIWADNGEVFASEPLGGFLSPSENYSLFSVWPFAVTFCVILAFTCTFGIYKVRKVKIRERIKK